MRTAAIIGCGKVVPGKEGFAIGHSHAKGYLEADENIILYAVDPNQENLNAFKEAFNLPYENVFSTKEELYNTIIPDYVSVCTWPKLHSDIVIEACNKGVKGVTCEKPIALTMKEITEIVEEAKKNNTKVSIAHQRRYKAVFNHLKRLLNEKTIGENVVLEARVNDGWDILSWTTHWFDMCNYLFNAEPKWILSGIDYLGEKRYNHQVENNSVIVAEYPENRQAIFITGPENYQTPQMILRGTSGTLFVHEEGNIEIYNKDGYQNFNATPFESEGFKGLFEELFNEVEHGKPNRCSIDYCKTATEMALAAHHSAINCKKVYLPLDVSYCPLEVYEKSNAKLKTDGEIAIMIDNHWGSGGPMAVVNSIEELTGKKPIVFNSEDGLKENFSDNVKTLIMYHSTKEADETTKKILEDWVNAGKQTIMLHATTGAYHNWELFHNWIGRIWVWEGENKSIHPHEPSVLRALNTNEVDFGWDESFLPRDEVFAKLKDVSPCVDLLYAEIPQGKFPAAWINKDLPNIAVWIPGHLGEMWSLPAIKSGLKALLRRG